jgi:hypothetical protein
VRWRGPGLLRVANAVQRDEAVARHGRGPGSGEVDPPVLENLDVRVGPVEGVHDRVDIPPLRPGVRGSVELRGVPGTWQLLAIDRHGPRAGSPEAEQVSMPTPGRRTAMRRSDRAVEAIARRTPWILRVAFMTKMSSTPNFAKRMKPTLDRIRVIEPLLENNRVHMPMWAVAATRLASYRTWDSSGRAASVT